MTFAQLYTAVADHLGPGRSFCLDVEMWRHGNQSPSFKWKLWVDRQLEAVTPELLLEQLKNPPETPEATLERLSDVDPHPRARPAIDHDAEDIGF